MKRSNWPALISSILSIVLVGTAYFLMWTMTIPRPSVVDSCACHAYLEIGRRFKREPWEPGWIEKRTAARCKVVIAIPNAIGSQSTQESNARLAEIAENCSYFSILLYATVTALLLSLGLLFPVKFALNKMRR